MKQTERKPVTGLKKFFFRAPLFLYRIRLGCLLGHIIGSFLATIHNICQYYNGSFYSTFREIVGRPLYVIYAVIFGSFIYYTYRVWLKEFEFAKTD